MLGRVMRTALAAASLALACAAPGFAYVHADADGDKVFDDLERRLARMGVEEPVRVIVTLRSPATAARVAGLSADVGGFDTGRRFSLVDAFVAEMTKADVVALARLPEVEQIEADVTVRAENNSAQDSFGVTKARADAGLDGDGDGNAASYSGDDLVAAVVDTGIDAGHADLDEGKVLASLSCVGGSCNSAPAVDANGHGTHVAATIAGEGDARPDRLYRGVAPAAGLISLRVLDATGKGSLSNAIAALQWIVANKAAYGIEVVNLSLGADGCSAGTDAGSAAVNNAQAAGLVVVASAGNEGPGSCSVGAPAAAAGALTVGAMADLGAGGFSLAAFSSRGPTSDGRVKPDVVAPGVGITSAEANTEARYVAWDGTSMAAPFVSGVALLMLDANRGLTPGDLKTRMTTSAVDWGPPGFDPDYGWGRLDGYASVRAAGAAIASPPPVPHHLLREGAIPATGGSAEFTFSVTDARFPLAITLTAPTWSETQGPSFSLDLYGPDGYYLTSGKQSRRQAEVSYRVPAPGVYRLQVSSSSRGTRFSLDVSGGFAPVPAATVAPSISGLAQEGETLSALPGAWLGSGLISLAYQWQRCNAAGSSCADVGGAAAGTYAVGVADIGSTLRVRVTATDALGFASLSSAPTAVVARAPDRQPPVARALASQGRRGLSVKLLYRVSDASGATSERVRVYRGTRLLRTLSAPLSVRETGRTYYVSWRAPRRAERLRFCVQARDAAGNASATSCAPLRIR